MTRFKVNLATGTVEGPKEYLESEAYQATKAKIERGEHVLIEAAPVGTPLATLIEVIFQTDYAAWLGMRSFAGQR